MGAPQCNLNYCVFFLLLLLMKHVLRHVLKKRQFFKLHQLHAPLIYSEK